MVGVAVNAPASVKVVPLFDPEGMRKANVTEAGAMIVDVQLDFAT